MAAPLRQRAELSFKLREQRVQQLIHIHLGTFVEVAASRQGESKAKACAPALTSNVHTHSYTSMRGQQGRSGMCVCEGRRRARKPACTQVAHCDSYE
eukprot:6179650-Pleurochrysis_carterae.AAC.2